MRRWVPWVVLFVSGCTGGRSDARDPGERRDGAAEAWIDVYTSYADGEREYGGKSIQNPCWSPDGQAMVVTVWDRYNEPPAYVGVVTGGTVGIALPISPPAPRVSVNLPGSCWNAANTLETITYSSDELDDEIYLADLLTESPYVQVTQVTDRPDFVAFEPSFSPDGQWIVFESHVLDDDGNGALFKVRRDGTQLTQLTDGSGDDRQPNWSPAGGLIVFQSQARTADGDWDLFLMNTSGGAIRNVTTSPLSEDTDASFSPDGRSLVFSSDLGGLELANLFVISTSGGAAIRVTDADRYDGAPSWSPDGTTIAFESYAYGDPDGHGGTSIWTIAAP